MNLKETADNLFQDSKRTPLRGLRAIAEAEKYLQQAYQGRYFFELIQNVRDANKEKNQDGEIFIELNNNILSISNTGAEFTTKGIEGITTIGESTKRSQDYIGFKGIGFKSIQEITEEPKIITRFGSIYFDRKLTLQKYNSEQLKEEQIPLFYFPHFNSAKLSDTEIQIGIVTKIELPIKENISEERIVAAFCEIQAKQLVLLGNIKTLHFKTGNNIRKFSIKKNSQKRVIEVQVNETSSINFKYFTPANKITIPTEIIQSLEGKEKDIFSNGSQVDINIILELAENGQIKTIEDAKLYLFYPLQINSGFRFIIHSYFIVNPERTALRDSSLNNFLLASIGDFIGKEMLRHLKESKTNTNRILCFKRNSDAKIDILYDCIRLQLKKQRFIYDSNSQKYYSAAEVMVADGFDKGLFPEGKLGGRQLIYTDDKEIIKWLQDEFEVPYLSYEDIANQIEAECKRQLKKRKLKFFQNLYNYVGTHEGLNLTGKKVLLTDDWRLVSSEDDVFYGGGRRNPINLPSSVKRQIHFINKEIKITDFREGRSRTGITEFNTFELVRRLLKLFDKNTVPNVDLLNTLYNLQPLDTKSELEIKEKISFPVHGTDKWLSPITNPIYFENDALKELYPDGTFINAGFLKWTGDETNTISPNEFLKKFGIWEIPAVYISNKQIRIFTEENRDKKIQTLSGLTSRPYYITNDRTLDIPVKYNNWFSETIINKWETYRSFIQDDLLPKFQYSSNQSYYRNVGKGQTIDLCHFIEILSAQKWIAFKGETKAYSVNEVIGIKYLDFSQSHNQVVNRYLKLLPISYEFKQELIESIGLVHLDGNSITNFIKLLSIIHKKYEVTIPAGKDFIDFYNRILSKLVDFFYNNSQTENIIRLRNEFFLAINEISKIPAWVKASQMFYIDDKPNYDLLPTSIKEKVQPHFTNRDKNTFGKIAAKIGKKFSNSIQKELIETKTIKKSTLISFFELLPESIAILESKLDTVLTDHFENLKNIRVYEKEKLEVKISVDNSDEMIIEANHFIDRNNNYDFHISMATNPNRNKQIAEAMSELFVNLLERDLRLYHSDLFRFLNTEEKKDYLRDYDILEERVTEIRDKLNTSDITSEQKFWEVILATKEINRRENIFIAAGIKLNQLAASLGVNDNLVQKIHDNFNFHQTSDSKNISLLIELLSSLSLTLKEINKNIFPKIDFRDYYQRLVTRQKNKFEKGFDSILHCHLSKKEKDEQCHYQDLLDDYKGVLPLSIPVNTLEMNIEHFFLESMSATFPFLKISPDDLQEDFSHFNPVIIYSANFSLLQAKIASLKFTKENLNTFLIDNKRRSLLYFDEVDVIADSFKEWLAQFNDKNNPTDDENSLEEFLSEFSNQTATPIEEFSTKEVDIPSPNGGPSVGNGKRFDGAANDQFKKRVGLVAEMVVYEKLKTVYANVNWVSKFASKVFKNHPGYNPEGQDGLGYDIEYFDSDGNKYLVEVKGRTDSFESFEISKNEIDKALNEKQFYKIFFVTQTMNNVQRRIRDLGNLFILEDGQDFFANRRFKAFYGNFEIRFQEQKLNSVQLQVDSKTYLK